MSTALLYFNLLSIESQLGSRNIREDGVSKSAVSMIRAARFCNFDSRSIFALDVVPQVIEP